MSEGIAYQNKDITFKILSESYKGKSFQAYGLDLPRIRKVLPTNLPVIMADEKRIDNLFLLEDGTIAIVDYESTDKFSDRIKYANYIVRVLEKYYKEKREIIRIRMIVIYTGDVDKADSTFETDCSALRMEQIFLKNLKSEELFQSIRQKVEQKQILSEKDLMQLIILPLTEYGNEKKQKRIEQVINLAKQIDEKEQVFVIAGVIVSSDKFINQEYADSVRSWLKMTKVGKLFEEERLETARKVEKETTKKIVGNLLEMDMDILQVMRATGLSRKEIEDIKEEILPITK